MRLSRDNLVLLGIAVVMTATYVLLVYRAQSNWLEDLSSQSAAIKRQIEADDAKAAVVPAMARDIEAMRRVYGEDWDIRLPQQNEQAEFLREISASLSEAKLFNQMIRLGQPAHGRLYNRLPITMEFEGEFLALARFLKHVDGMTRLTRIEELKIRPIQGSHGLSIKLGMNIYFTEQ